MLQIKHTDMVCNLEIGIKISRLELPQLQNIIDKEVQRTIGLRGSSLL